MTEDNDTDRIEDFSERVLSSHKARVAANSAEMLEKGDDFSSEAEPTEESGTSTDTPEELKAKLSEAEDRVLRMAAEFDNYRKRNARQQEELIRAANDRLINELLEVIDNFERALQHAREDAIPSAVLTGTEMIYGQLVALLSKQGITPIDALGKPFDPQFHEAMMQMESDKYPEGTVALEMGKGYAQGNRVIRHTKVGVSRGKG